MFSTMILYQDDGSLLFFKIIHSYLPVRIKEISNLWHLTKSKIQIFLSKDKKFS